MSIKICHACSKEFDTKEAMDTLVKNKLCNECFSEAMKASDDNYLDTLDY